MNSAPHPISKLPPGLSNPVINQVHHPAAPSALPRPPLPGGYPVTNNSNQFYQQQQQQ